MYFLSALFVSHYLPRFLVHKPEAKKEWYLQYGVRKGVCVHFGKILLLIAIFRADLIPFFETEQIQAILPKKKCTERSKKIGTLAF